MKKEKAVFVSNLIIIVFASLSIFSASASALKNVIETGLLIENVDEEHRKCGITKNMIDAAVRIPLSNSKLTLTGRMVDSYIYVNVNAREISNFCALNISLEFKKYIPSQGDVGSFWYVGGLAVWTKNNAPTMVSTTLEGFSKELVGAWIKANSN